MNWEINVHSCGPRGSNPTTTYMGEVTAADYDAAVRAGYDLLRERGWPASAWCDFELGSYRMVVQERS